MYALHLLTAFFLAQAQLVVSGVGSVTFLVTVNDTWKWNPPIENDTCMVTVKTYALPPNAPLNKTEKVMVGDCDSGPLVYTVQSSGKNKASLFLTFHSSVIEDASPPTCTIDWNYSYRLPTTTLGPVSERVAEESLLPGCFTADSREGYHMTNYWFYVIDWSLTSEEREENRKQMGPLAVISVSFLVAVNQTESQCLMTSKTPGLKPGVVHNQTQDVHIGTCDEGTLDFNITAAKDDKGAEHTYVDVVFHSHDMGDALPPTCKILWDYSYLVPSDSNPQRSLLPGCYTSLSRGGNHVTYYWFYVIDWAYG